MVLGVELSRLVAVVLSVKMVSVGDMGMVRCLFVKTCGMCFRGRMVVTCGVLMVFCRLPVVLYFFLVGHVFDG